MPELPEVEVVRSGLSPALTGARIERVEVHDPRALTRHPGDPEDFAARLTGRLVTGAARRGKFLWFPLHDAPEAVVGHLGMSGQLLLREPGGAVERHERIRLSIEHPSHGALDVLFVDQRTFGSLAIDDLEVTPDGAAGGFGDAAALVPTQAAHIARDILDPAFDARAASRRIRSSASAIKRLLLDQRLVSGIGNIYADESLWGAKIHPETPGDALSARAVSTLFTRVREVLTKALAEGGTSFDAQYVNVNGQAGYFAHSLHAYGRDGEPCPRCGRAIVREAFMNRSSHYCPRCQRR